MEKFLSKLEKFLLPIATRLNSYRILAALRDGFIAVMPLMLIGAFAVMINNVFLNLSEGSLIASTFFELFDKDPIPNDELPAFVQQIRSIIDTLGRASISIVALVVSFSIAYNLSEIKGYKGLEAGIISVAAFILTLNYVPDAFSLTDASFAVDSAAEGQTVITALTDNVSPVSAYNGSYFGAANIITAILVALFTGELYTMLLKKNIRIKMPEGVPPAVERSFSALIPATVILLILAILQQIVISPNGILGEYEFVSLSEFVQQVISAPLKQIAGGAAGLYVYTTLVDVFWFFGIHGPNTLAFLDQGVFTPAAIENANLISLGLIDNYGIIDQAGYDQYLIDNPGGGASVYTKTLVDSFIFLGGSGTTIGLVIALIVGSKVEADKKIGKYALAPALFNINEPLLFGLPIVFNPVLFIPYVLIQPILLTLVLIVMNIGLVPQYGVLIPWTSPPVIGAFLGYGSFSAALLALVCVVISTLVYLPFVIVMNRQKNAEKAEME